MKTTIDLARFFTFIIACVLASRGLVSWWVVLLFFVYSMELEIEVTTKK